MASSSETFAKLDTWRKSNTPLKVTVIVGGKTTDVLTARIGGMDPDAGLVALAFDETRSFKSLDIEDAEYSVEQSRVVVTRNESDWLVFEES
jgi:hypothetical protein